MRPPSVLTRSAYPPRPPASTVLSVGAERQTYVVDDDGLDRTQAEAVSAAVLEVLTPALFSATIDAVSDYDSVMPARVRDAERELRSKARQERPRRCDPITATIRVSDPLWPAVETYGAWSIAVELVGRQGSSLGSFADSLAAVTLQLTSTEAAALRRRIVGIAPVVLLEVALRQQREERRAQLRRRLRRWARLSR